MTDWPVVNPTKLERALSEAGLPEIKPIADFYDAYTRTSAHREWVELAEDGPDLDVHDPERWDDKLHASTLGEWFAHFFRDCRRVLDVGCGQGWPSLYLARYIPEVVGIDVSRGQIEDARAVAERLGLDNVTFEVGDANELRFSDGSFDGICFCASFVYPQSDPQKELEEACRVLRPGGLAAFATFLEVGAPPEPAPPNWEEIGFFMDAGPPALHYWAGSVDRSRRYLIYLDPDSPDGQRLLAARGGSSGEQKAAQEGMARKLETGALGSVTEVWFTGDGGGPVGHDPGAFLEALQHAGFAEIASWVLPDTRGFSHALAEAGLLARLRQEDLIPTLRALARSAHREEGCRSWLVSCTKPT
jgi:ubiquinone/menaquinone biosynthesis C-methylase UbiE